MGTTRVLVHHQGGVISSVHTTGDVELLFLDYDIEGLDEADTHTHLGQEFYLHSLTPNSWREWDEEIWKLWTEREGLDER